MVSERRHARQKLQSLEYVEIGREGPGNGGFLLDLSEDGAAVQMAHPASLEDEIQIRFSLGAAGNVRAQGRITWRDKAGKALGICFTDLDDPTRARITQWLAENEGIPGYEWSVPSASTATPRKQPAEAPARSAATQPDQAPESAATDAVPVPGEARFINIAAAERQIHHTTVPPAPVAMEPTATFVPVVTVNPATRLTQRNPRGPDTRPPESSSRMTTANNSAPSDSFADNRATAHVNTVANRIAPVRSDPLDRKNRPASTPYFSLDSMADQSADGVADDAAHNANNDVSMAVADATLRPGLPPVPSGRSWLSEPGALDIANRTQPAGNRLLLKNVVVAGVPALIIVLALAYSITHSGHSGQSRTIAPVGSANTQLGAPSQPASSPYDDIGSLYPAPLGPGGAPSGALGAAPSPYAIPPPSSLGASRSSAVADSGKQPSSKQPLTKQSMSGSSLVVTPPSSSASGGDSAAAAPGATDPSAGSQPGDREYSFGLQSLAGKGDTPGSTAAASYFWLAVTDGNVRAEVALAQLYLRGDGVPKSCDQARVLLSAAAGRGSTEAPRILASLSSYGCEPPVNNRR